MNRKNIKVSSVNICAKYPLTLLGLTFIKLGNTTATKLLLFVSPEAGRFWWIEWVRKEYHSSGKGCKFGVDYAIKLFTFSETQFLSL